MDKNLKPICNHNRIPNLLDPAKAAFRGETSVP